MTNQPSSQDHTFEGAKKSNFVANLPIGTKLAIGFGFLVVLTFLSAGISFYGSRQATDKIDLTSNARVPAALVASRAQANLLRMQADVRGYLALGEASYRESYESSRIAFEKNLSELDDLSQNLDAKNRQRLQELNDTYKKWAEQPDILFALRDDQLDREPAYRMLVITGTLQAGEVLVGIKSMIDTQGDREPTKDNQALLEDMAKFQGNFAAMLSALRGYVTTRNRIYRVEYEVNLTDNQNAWDRINEQTNKLTTEQRALLQNVAQNRDAFLQLPAQMFVILQSPNWREDLFRFSAIALPLANDMQQKLNEIVLDQQTSLQTELAAGQRNLALTTQLILFGGLIALLFGLGAWFFSSSTIAGPVRRLTGIAERIRSGDLEAQATVESKDEIGTLASTFNNMTTKLRQTLLQVRKEKKRADDLLEVVIPIGVELSTEKDFNRLLEKMLVEAKTFCHADTGMLYLRPSQEKQELKHVIVRNDSQQIALGGTTGKEIPFVPLPLADPDSGEPNHRNVVTHVALSGATTHIVNAVQAKEFDFMFSQSNQDELLKSYQVQSLLAIPLKNSEGQVLGVMQLINPQDTETNQIGSFDQNLQQMMESFSSLAVAALEAYIREQSLRMEIQQLRIEIDEAKRQKQVDEIVNTDFFQHISIRAQELRERNKKK